jgi:hypothetical protein
MDVLVLGALIGSRQSLRRCECDGRDLHLRRIRLGAILCGWLLASVGLGAAMATYEPMRLGDVGELLGDGRTVVLTPERWVGKRFPLLDYIDIGERLAEGEWTVLLYHHDCPRCQEVIAHYAELANRWPTDRNGRRIAFVEVPPYAGSLPRMVHRSAVGHLEDKQKWFVTTPLEVVLSGGRTKTVTTGNAPVGQRE